MDRVTKSLKKNSTNILLVLLVVLVLVLAYKCLGSRAESFLLGGRSGHGSGGGRGGGRHLNKPDNVEQAPVAGPGVAVAPGGPGSHERPVDDRNGGGRVGGVRGGGRPGMRPVDSPM